MEKLSKRSSRAIIWSAIERIATQGMQFLLMIYLARILGPSAFGTIGMISIFVGLGQTLSDGGLSVVLLKKSEITDSEYTSAFSFNLITSSLIWITICSLSPLIADFYKSQDLLFITPILSFNIVLSALALVYRSKLMRLLEFKTMSLVSVFGLFCGAIAAFIALEFTQSAWVLVIQSLTANITSLATIVLIVKWKPSFKINQITFSILWKDSKSILSAALIDVFFTNMYNVAIGKFFNAKDLGHFNQANQISLTPSSTASLIINRVAFSTLSELQSSRERFLIVFEKFLKISLLVVAPISGLIALNSNDLVDLILGKDWKEIADLIIVLSIGYAIYPVHLISVSALQILGDSKEYLKLEITKKILLTAIFLGTFSKGIFAMCIGITFGSAVSLAINSLYGQKVTGLPLTKQVRITLGAASITLIAAIIASLTPSVESVILNITLRTIVFVTVYTAITLAVFKSTVLEAISLILKRKD